MNGITSRPHPPVRQKPGPWRRGTSANLRAVQRRTRCRGVQPGRGSTPPGGEGQHDGHGHLRERHHEQHAARVVAIREEPCRAGENDRRRPERDVQQGDRDPRPVVLRWAPGNEGDPVPSADSPTAPRGC
jgi:hypothetical protein